MDLTLGNVNPYLIPLVLLISIINFSIFCDMSQVRSFSPCGREGPGDAIAAQGEKRHADAKKKHEEEVQRMKKDGGTT